MSRSQFRQVGAAFVQATKLAVWPLLNWHRAGDRPHVALLGSRRSGSTLLLQVLGQVRGFKTVDHAMPGYGVPDHLGGWLPYSPGGFFIGMNERELALVADFYRAILEGRLHTNEPWRVWRREHRFRSSRVAMKCTHSHFLEPLLAAMPNVRIVRFFRHPVSQALSCRRNDWGSHLRLFRESTTFQYRMLNAEQRELFAELDREKGDLAEYVLAWACENFALLRSRNEAGMTLFYEDTVMEPELTVRRLAAHCDLEDEDRMLKAIARPSLSTRTLSTDRTKGMIRGGDREALVTRWLDHVSASETAICERILQTFNVPFYSPHDPMPSLDRRPVTSMGKARSGR